MRGESVVFFDLFWILLGLGRVFGLGVFRVEIGFLELGVLGFVEFLVISF